MAVLARARTWLTLSRLPWRTCTEALPRSFRYPRTLFAPSARGKSKGSALPPHKAPAAWERPSSPR
eukprot:1191343-Prorocentrum_minimum.AAC.6